MSRTNIDIDDDLVATVMRRYSLRTKREAVHLALVRLAGPPVDRSLIESVRGVGWDGDLDQMRAVATDSDSA